LLNFRDFFFEESGGGLLLLKYIKKKRRKIGTNRAKNKTKVRKEKKGGKGNQGTSKDEKKAQGITNLC